MSRTSRSPRPLRVAHGILDIPRWFWYCRKCAIANGYADTCDEANTNARAHWPVCTSTDADCRRVMAYRADGAEL